MGAKNISSIFSISDVISTELQGEKKTVMAMLGDNATGVADFAAEVWSPAGLASRPSIADPKDANGAANALSINTSGQNIILGLRDARNQELYGDLKPGDTALYGGGQGRVLIKNNGSVNLYTTKGNGKGAAGMGIFMDPVGDISVVSHTGTAILVKSDNSISLFNSESSIQITEEKIGINSAKVAIASSLTVGMPLPTDSLVHSLPLTQILAAIDARLNAMETAWTVMVPAVAAISMTGAPVAGAMASSLVSIAAAQTSGAAISAASTPLLATKSISAQ